MKLIKSYQVFLESMQPEIDLFSSVVELYHCGDHIWAIKSPDHHTRALLFMRSQEYYESIFEEIVRKQFSVNKFVDLYKQHYGKKDFTYGSDWAGFNIPSEILEECMDNVPEEETNNWDVLMKGIIDIIRLQEGDNKWYLLGVDELENSLLEHEFAHAMWYTLSDYKAEMAKLNEECDPQLRDMMCRCITEYGYADHVLSDELQAYMATGLGQKMVEMNIPNIDEWCQKYRDVFERYYSKSLYPNPMKVDIWNS